MEFITKLKIWARYKVKYSNPKLVFRMLGVPTWDMHQKSKKIGRVYPSDQQIGRKSLSNAMTNNCKENP